MAGHHVHFPEDISANTEIQIQMKGDSIANVHLGFLQHKHKYQIQLNLPISPRSTSLTPIINTPFIAVGNVNSPGKFVVIIIFETFFSSFIARLISSGHY